MQIMPPAFGFGESKFFDKKFFALQVFHHFFNGNVVVSNGRRFSKTDAAKMFQLNDESGLVRFGAAVGDGKRITEGQVVCFVKDFQPPVPLKGRLGCIPLFLFWIVIELNFSPLNRITKRTTGRQPAEVKPNG